MKNRIVGILIIGMAAVIGFMVFSFNQVLTNLIQDSCTHGFACPMWGTLSAQTNTSIVIIVFIIIIGLYLIFFGKEEKVVTRIIRVQPHSEKKKITKAAYAKVMADMNKDERLVLEKIIEAKGSIFQSDLVKKTNLNKVRVTRLLDKLEGKGVIDRKRRGMTNIVMLRH